MKNLNYPACKEAHWNNSRCYVRIRCIKVCQIHIKVSICAQNYEKIKNKTVIRILTQNDVNSKSQLFHRKVATAENTDQAAHVHWSLVRYYTACLEMLFEKDSMTKRHMNIYTLIWVSPLFENQGRMHKQWRLISIYICNVWSMTCFLDNFEKKNLTKNAAINKIHLSHLNASMA